MLETPSLAAFRQPGFHDQHPLPQVGKEMTERPQIIQRLQGTAKATDPFEEVVQAAPGKAARIAVGPRVGLCDTPFNQRIALHMVRAVFFGNTLQPFKLVSGKADALPQGRIFSCRCVSASRCAFKACCLRPVHQRRVAAGQPRPI